MDNRVTSCGSKKKNKAYAYLLINKEGEVYAGATVDLKARLKRHNSGMGKEKWTRGRYWYYVAVWGFDSFECAFKWEKSLKTGRKKKRVILTSSRVKKILIRHSITLINYQVFLE